jgi:hypothetical protein
VRLLAVLAKHVVPTWLIVSSHGWRLLREECGIADEAALRAETGRWKTITLLPDGDRGAAPASGSRKTAGMVICPCSMATVAAVAHGTSRSLIERAPTTLKERRTHPRAARRRRRRWCTWNLTAVARPVHLSSGRAPLPPAEKISSSPIAVQNHRSMELGIDIAPRWKP